MSRTALIGPLRVSEAEQRLLETRAAYEGKKLATFLRDAAMLYCDIRGETCKHLALIATSTGIRPGLLIEAILASHFAEVEAVRSEALPP